MAATDEHVLAIEHQGHLIARSVEHRQLEQVVRGRINCVARLLEAARRCEGWVWVVIGASDVLAQVAFLQFPCKFLEVHLRGVNEWRTWL